MVEGEESRILVRVGNGPWALNGGKELKMQGGDGYRGKRRGRGPGVPSEVKGKLLWGRLAWRG